MWVNIIEISVLGFRLLSLPLLWKQRLTLCHVS